MRICVIGNSHASSLRRGWASVAAKYPGHELVFFASRGNALADLEIAGQALVPATAKLARDIEFTSGGLKEIRPADFDAVLLYGLSLAIPYLDPRLSDAVARAACLDSALASTAVELARKIRSVSDRRIWIGPNPVPVARADGPARPPKWSHDEVLAVFGAAIRVPGTALLAQPAATLLDGWSTRTEYLKDALTLDVGDSDSGRAYGGQRHMNAEYGKAWLEHFMAHHVGGQAAAA